MLLVFFTEMTVSLWPSMARGFSDLFSQLRGDVIY